MRLNLPSGHIILLALTSHMASIPSFSLAFGVETQVLDITRSLRSFSLRNSSTRTYLTYPLMDLRIHIPDIQGKTKNSDLKRKRQ